MMYVFMCFLVFNLLAFFAPKRLVPIEIYATCIFAYAYGVTTDLVLDLHYNLYGYLQKGFQWLTLLAVIMYFPSISFLFLNFYPFNKALKKSTLYFKLDTFFCCIRMVRS